MEAGAKEPNDRDARQGVSDVPCVVYVTRADATPEGELGALAVVYAFVLERHEQKQGTAEVSADANTTKVGGADISGEVRPIKRGGGRHAEEG